MYTSLHTHALVGFVVLFGLSTSAIAQEELASYPITLDADDVYELTDLNIASNGLQLTAERVTAVPIRCKVGVTGVMLLGDGEFRFKPEGAEEIGGAFRGAMLRFNPEDQNGLVVFDQNKATTDHAAKEMSQHLLNNVFRHCWHRGMEALIPDAGSLVANVYSKEHGDLLISTSPGTSTVYNFSARELVFQSK